MEARLQVLSTDALNAITDLLEYHEICKLLCAGDPTLKIRLLEQPGIRSVHFWTSRADRNRKPFLSPSSFAFKMTFLRSLTIMASRDKTSILHEPEMKLSAFPPTLTLLRLSYPFSVFAAVDISPDKPPVDALSGCKPHISEWLSSRDPRTLLFRVKDILPQLQVLGIAGPYNWSIIGHNRPAEHIHHFLQGLPSTLHTLETDWITCAAVDKYAPPSVIHIAADTEDLPDLASTMRNLLSRFETVRFASSFAHWSRALRENGTISKYDISIGIKAAVEASEGNGTASEFAGGATAPNSVDLSRLRVMRMPVQHIYGRPDNETLTHCPELKSLEIPISLSWREWQGLSALPRQLTSLHLHFGLTNANLALLRPLPLRKLHLARIGGPIREVLFPVTLTDLLVKEAVFMDSNTIVKLPPGLTSLALLGESLYDRVLGHFGQALRFLTLRTYFWTGIYFDPAADTLDELSSAFWAGAPKNLCLLPKRREHVSIKALPEHVRLVSTRCDLSSIPLEKLPRNLQSLGHQYPLNQPNIENVPRSLTHLDVFNGCLLSHAQFRHLPSSITFLRGGFFCFDTEESIDDAMARMASKKATYFKCPESLLESMFSGNSATSIKPIEIKVDFKLRYLEKLPGTVTTIITESISQQEIYILPSKFPAQLSTLVLGPTTTALVDCLPRNITSLKMTYAHGIESALPHFKSLTEATLGKLVLLNIPEFPPNLRTLSIVDPTSHDSALERLIFPPSLTQLGLYYTSKSREQPARHLAHLPPSVAILIIRGRSVTASCLTYLPDTINTLILGRRDETQHFREVLQKRTAAAAARQ